MFLAVFCNISAFCQGDVETIGTASFYANKFEGRRTSSGEIFHQRKMTCAHRTLPFGTTLQVTNLSNNKSVVVTVNDRGPYGKGRIVDLTTAAAKELDFIKSGTTRVQIEILIEPNIADSVLQLNDSASTVFKIEPADTLNGLFTLKLVSCARFEKAEQIIKQARSAINLPVYLRVSTQNRLTVYTLYAGNFSRYEDALSLLSSVQGTFPQAQPVRAKQ